MVPVSAAVVMKETPEGESSKKALPKPDVSKAADEVMSWPEMAPKDEQGRVLFHRMLDQLVVIPCERPRH